MKLYLSGADQPVSRDRLTKLGVHRIAVSFYEWRERYMDNELFQRMPAGAEVVITSGVSKKESIDFDLFATDYAEFCEYNADRVELFFDIDAPACPLTTRKSFRARMDGFNRMVVFPYEGETLNELSTRYEWLGVNSSMAKSVPVRELRRLPNDLCGSNVTAQSVLAEARFHSTVTHAWLSARRFGELWIFAGGKLKHYTSQNRPKAAHVHRNAIQALGGDVDACVAGDHDSLILLAVRSLQAMEEHLTTRPRDRSKAQIADISPEESDTDQNGTEPIKPAALPVPATPRARVTLPTVMVNGEGNDQVVRSRDQSMRECDSCYLAEACPKFEDHASCAYEIPVMIRTAEQREAASQVLAEIQFRRASFGAFAEEVEGNGLTPRVGQEIDRWFKVMKDIKTLETPIPGDNPDKGILSKIFGEALAQNQTSAFESLGRDLVGDDDDEEAIEAEEVTGPGGEADNGPPF